ncbi:hypothetical protein GCM10023321_72210 [Pseudonocardia eucalypti]|uniref:Amidohydrolase n=1 Tax=Pseudonocardia eucalypti TaxID=648755 RepID=A0ABP9R7N1_9PSEU
MFALVGAGGTERTDYPHHHPRFDIDERVLLVGLRFFLGMVLDRRGR